MEFAPGSKTCDVVVLGFLILGLLSVQVVECGGPPPLGYQGITCRKHSALLTDFGGKGDGLTLNTAAFRNATAQLSKFGPDGGSVLVVPPGKWLTGAFNLTSNFTLFLQKGAIILGSQVETEYPLIEPLKSYGRGRDAPGGRYMTLVSGSNLTDVVITGENGTIDGQGLPWWDKYRAKKLIFTRPYMIEILYSNQVQISNITLVNSPSWFVHPTYCSDVIIQGLTITAPVDSPNTDGIDPDSCTNTKIEDCFIVSGDDCIAVKSGWDQFGIQVAMPTSHLIIRRLTCISPDSAVIALGSEMSGGIIDLRAEDITAINSQSGVRVKSSPGRGGFVKDIFVRRLIMNTMEYVFWSTGAYGSHPDNGFDPNALPEVNNINFRDIVGNNVSMTANLAGIANHPYTGFCFSNVTINLSPAPKPLQWNCTDIAGVTNNVRPPPCPLLPDKPLESGCAFPIDVLPIDKVKLQNCKVPPSGS